MSSDGCTVLLRPVKGEGGAEDRLRLVEVTTTMGSAQPSFMDLNDMISGFPKARESCHRLGEWLR